MSIVERIEKSPVKYFLWAIGSSISATIAFIIAVLFFSNSEIVTKGTYVLMKDSNPQFISRSEYDKIKNELDSLKSAIIQKATWVFNEKAIKILNDQITVEISYISNFSVTCKLTIPGQDIIHKSISKGESYEFNYKTEKYSLTLLDTYDEVYSSENDKALISVNKIL